MAEPEPTEPAEDEDVAYETSRPLWTAFLIPAAIVIAGALVSLTIFFTRNAGGDDAPAAASDAGGLSQAPRIGTPLAAVVNLYSTFTGYAREVGADEAKFQACLNSPGLETLIQRQLQEGIRLGVNGTPTLFINNKMVVGTQPFTVFEELINAELAGSPTTFDGYSTAVKQLVATGRIQIAPSLPDLRDAHFEGSGGAKAKVVIAEFSDFQCPFCKKWSEDNIARIRQRLGADVSLAFVHFPIVQIHPNAGNASAAAICAGEQGKFWPMHDVLFKRQQEWERLQ